MYNFLLLPLLSGLIAQLLKFIIKSNRLKFNLKNFVSYSGMPSSHAAIIISLTTIVGLKQGLVSPLFAVCFVFSLLVIRDAVGLRTYLGQHSEVLNDLVMELKKDFNLDAHYPHLREHTGHTPAQIIVGSFIGFFISLTGFFIL